MGQYHTIYNLDKKESYSLGGAKLWEKACNALSSMGLNVLLCNSNGRGGGDLSNRIRKEDKDYSGKKVKSLKSPKYKRWSNELQKEVNHTKDEYEAIKNALEAIQGRWSGDRIVIQGDYAEPKDPSFIPEETLNEFKDITPLVLEAFKQALKYDDADELKASLGFELRSRGEK